MKKFSAIPRVLAFLLVVCFCSAFLPVMTFAADVTPGTITITSTEGETVILEEGKTTVTIGKGCVTYDVANNSVTLTALNVAKIDFAMNGDFIVNVVGENVVDSTALKDPTGAITVSSGNATVNGTGSLFLTSTAKAINVTGNITFTCSKVDLNTTAGDGSAVSGIFTISGSTVIGRSTGCPIRATKGIVISNNAKVNVYSQNGRAIDAQAVSILDSNVCTFVEEADGTKLISKYGIIARTGDLCITNSTIDAIITNNSALFVDGAGDDLGIKIVGSTINAEGQGNLLRSDSNISIVNSTVDVTGTNGGTIINAAMTVKIQGSDVDSKATGEKAIYSKTGIEIDDSIVDANSTGNTIYAKDLIISGDPYNEETEKGTYVNSYGREYAIYATNSMTINGGTIKVKSIPNDPKYGVFGGFNFVQNGGNITVTVENDNPAFDLRGGNFTLSGGSFVIKGKAGPAFCLRSNNTGLVLNGGSLTGSVGSLMTQANIVNTNMVNVGPYANVDLIFSTGAAFTGKNITVNAEGVTWEEGKELTPTSGAAKTVSTTTVDVPLSATVTLNGKAQADQTVELYDGETLLDTAVTDADGKVTLTATGLTVGNTYTLTLKQVATNGGGWYYDTNEYIITVTVVDGKVTIEGEAVFTNTDRVPFADGKIIDGKYVVTATNTPTEMGLIEIDGAYYYVGPNGVLVTNQDYYAWQLNAVCDKAKDWYTFDAEGKMVISGLYNGRYYVDAIPTEVGLFYNEADETYYCAGPNGKLVTGKEYYVWKIHTSVQGFSYNWYRFDETGALYQGVADNKYYVDGRPTEIGLFKDKEGKYYCAGPGGKLVAGREYYVWMIDASAAEDFGYGWYNFNEDGTMILPLNGVHEGNDGNFYYYVDGKPTDAGLVYWNGNYYFANAGGKIVAKDVKNEYGTSGSYYVWKIDASAFGMKTGWYNFDENGKMILPLNGIQKIDGVLYYYENGKPADIGLFKYEDNYYFANAGGKLVAECVQNEYDDTGSYYVWKIHESVQGEIPTGWYEFDAEGKLIVK